VTVAANTSSAARTGTVSVQGQVFTVTQAGAAPDCSYGVTPPAFSFTSAGGTGEVEVLTTTGCGWTVVSDQSWLTPAVTSGNGNGPVAFTVRWSNAASSRAARLTIGPWVVTVNQDGKPRRVK
jgi:hypothetical protein